MYNSLTISLYDTGYDAGQTIDMVHCNGLSRGANCETH